MKKSIFVEGSIPADVLTKMVVNHKDKTEIGAHSCFLGQVRADEINGEIVQAIEYTCYQEMADQIMQKIREEAFANFEITCAHVQHSLGRVDVGDLCFFVFTSAPHRKSAINACNFFVERIKFDMPIFGKEIFQNETHRWKKNQ